MFRVYAAVFALVALANPAWPLVTSDQPGSHVVAPGQPAFGLDLDGVAIVGGAPPFGPPIRVCTGALVSHFHVLCAAHCFDKNADGQLESPMAPFPESVVFQSASGPLAIEYEIELVQGPENWPEQSADIAVISLTRNAPSHLPRYSLYGRTDEVGRTAVLTGFGLSGHGSTGDSGGPMFIGAAIAGVNAFSASTGCRRRKQPARLQLGKRKSLHARQLP